MAQKVGEQIQIDEGFYGKLNRGNCRPQSSKDIPDSIYELLALPERKDVSGTKESSKKKWSLVKTAAVVIVAVIIILLTSATLIVLLIKTSQIEARLESLKMKSEIHNESYTIPRHHCSCTSNTSSENKDQTEADGTATASFPPITSCRMLPKSFPSGHYQILSSDGSTMRVYCDMNRKCGNITGGWMRVANLDMSRASSLCPSGLCLNTASPHTCRRCSIHGVVSSVPLVTYNVGVSYSKVCGRLIAYQVGSPRWHQFNLRKFRREHLEFCCGFTRKV